MKCNHKNNGFTLMEMLIVVAIIAVLVAIAIPTFTTSLERSRQAVDAANARSTLAVLAASVMSGDVEFPADTKGQTKGIWVTVVRDGGWPKNYDSQQSSPNMFCGSDPGIFVRGVEDKESGHMVMGNSALAEIVRSSIGD